MRYGDKEKDQRISGPVRPAVAHPGHARAQQHRPHGGDCVFGAGEPSPQMGRHQVSDPGGFDVQLNRRRQRHHHNAADKHPQQRQVPVGTPAGQQHHSGSARRQYAEGQCQRQRPEIGFAPLLEDHAHELDQRRSGPERSEHRQMPVRAAQTAHDRGVQSAESGLLSGKKQIDDSELQSCETQLLFDRALVR
ncbi:hypothetical protein SDC9_171740 [bioreactor metagenome]|uniref:Uncharacterized protein n=1 Tax=bioreactor metagenome TaxID=1076179 RepID=A0A645GEA1_9ZZZZ